MNERDKSKIWWADLIIGSYLIMIMITLIILMIGNAGLWN